MSMALDLNEAGAVETLVAEMANRNLVPAVVINNAGFGLAGPLAELSRDEQLRMIDLNVRVLTDLTLRFLPAMIASKSGGIINVASVAGFMPGPMMAVYFATKNYVLSFGDALEFGTQGHGRYDDHALPRHGENRLSRRAPGRMNEAPRCRLLMWRARDGRGSRPSAGLSFLAFSTS